MAPHLFFILSQADIRPINVRTEPSQSQGRRGADKVKKKNVEEYRSNQKKTLRCISGRKGCRGADQVRKGRRGADQVRKERQGALCICVLSIIYPSALQLKQVLSSIFLYMY